MPTQSQYPLAKEQKQTLTRVAEFFRSSWQQAKKFGLRHQLNVAIGSGVVRHNLPLSQLFLELRSPARLMDTYAPIRRQTARFSGILILLVHTGPSTAFPRTVVPWMDPGPLSRVGCFLSNLGIPLGEGCRATSC